ncbi:uncharacterized protein LOC141911533 [Tubulanus polymorphus]|uniref:uncharacterized protein LOC141911533 n=1 Tax=Tubulanus polymorphus TaxID=672921 RepID=UPI003DA69316
MATGDVVALGPQRPAPGIISFINEALISDVKCQQYLMSQRLLATELMCETCNVAMKLTPRQNISDGVAWYCRLCQCTKSIRNGSYFSRSKLKLQTLLLIIYSFGIDLQQYELQKLEPNINAKAVMDHYHFLQEIMSAALMKKPTRMGGNVVDGIVEIDESLFGKKAKAHRGISKQRNWIFGLCQPGTRNLFLRVVPCRSSDTLVPIIREVVETCATVYSDMWSA